MSKLKIVRTITYVSESAYPESYDGMTLDEAIAWEQNMETADAVEMLHEAMGWSNLTDDQLQSSVIVRVIE